MLKLLSAALYLSLLCVCMDVAHAAIEYVDVTGGINFATTGNPNGRTLFAEQPRLKGPWRSEGAPVIRDSLFQDLRASDGWAPARKRPPLP